MPSPSLQREPLPEPVSGWRAWRLAGTGDPGTLRLRPVIGRITWSPRRASVARCRRLRFHSAPDPGCTCGLYAWKSLDRLHKSGEGAVIGTVAMWGRVIEHLHGFRSATAYPQRLQLVCPRCLWERGLAQARPDRVVRVGRDRLVPLCDEHLANAIDAGLMRPRAVLPASEIEAGLVGEYAVDLLRLDVADTAWTATRA